jgi:anti-sigma regulatory factor (Ser/Thr protein kinase)
VTPATMPAADRAWCMVVPHHPRGAGLARRRLAGEVSDLLPAEMLADAIAVVAELVGNAIRHARGLDGDVVRVAWSMRSAGGRQVVEVRVTDGGGPDVPQRRLRDVTSPDGRGIAIIEALSDAWGVERDGFGQCVWAEIARAVTVPELGSAP